MVSAADKDKHRQQFRQHCDSVVLAALPGQNSVTVHHA
ncbi:hypothetical protein ECP02989429_2877 [Escherichia coli P0298942.9]|nr:hypothetical protein ECP02989429_2877 [Escherichia coli P0298942.9]